MGMHSEWWSTHPFHSLLCLKRCSRRTTWLINNILSLSTDLISGKTEKCALTEEDKAIFPNCQNKMEVRLIEVVYWSIDCLHDAFGSITRAFGADACEERCWCPEHTGQNQRVVKRWTRPCFAGPAEDGSHSCCLSVSLFSQSVTLSLSDGTHSNTNFPTGLWTID